MALTPRSPLCTPTRKGCVRGTLSVGCTAPETQSQNPGSSFTLSPGATLQVNCQATPTGGPGTILSGVGTVTLYGQCVSFMNPNVFFNRADVSLLDSTMFCSQEPSTIVAQAPFNWSINIQPAGGFRNG